MIISMYIFIIPDCAYFIIPIQVLDYIVAQCQASTLLRTTLIIYIYNTATLLRTPQSKSVKLVMQLLSNIINTSTKAFIITINCMYLSSIYLIEEKLYNYNFLFFIF